MWNVNVFYLFIYLFIFEIKLFPTPFAQSCSWNIVCLFMGKFNKFEVKKKKKKTFNICCFKRSITLKKSI